MREIKRDVQIKCRSKQKWKKSNESTKKQTNESQKKYY